MAKDADDLALISDLLELSLAAFQTDPSATREFALAVAGVQTAHCLLSSEIDPDAWLAGIDARRALVAWLEAKAAAGAPAKAASGPAACGPSPGGGPMALHRLALTLVQIDPANPGAWQEVESSFRQLSVDPGLPAGSRDLCLEATELIAVMRAGQAPDFDAAYAEVCRRLEEAADLVSAEVAFAEPRPAAGGQEQGQVSLPMNDEEMPAVEAAAAAATIPPVPAPPVLAPAIAASTVPAAASPAAPAAAGGQVAASLLEGLPADADPTLLGDFVTESRDLSEAAEAALLELETDPDSVEAVNTVFRAFHTVKGTSGFLGIKLLTEVAHRAENLLSRMRDREIRCEGGYADLALRSVDMLKELVERVHAALGGEPLTAPPGYAGLLEILSDPEAAGVSGNTAAVSAIAREDGDPADETAAAVPAEIPGAGPEPASSASADPSGGEAGRGARALRKAGAESGSDSSVRVRTDRLDRLIDMVGELVIAQSMVAQDRLVNGGQQVDLQRKVSHAGKIVRELQDLSMSMRMVPLKATFQKMNRLVRDLAHKSGKQVEFVASGEETEIDRNMVDVIGDPLVHMIRNAVDHGIERPDDRAARGKPAGGTVWLSAFHAGGNVVVRMEDDGKGLDREKIVQKAVDRGLIDGDKNLTDTEVWNLIFEPGFSTADKITEVSGRGVGMDVVKRAITSLRGRVEIESTAGRGTAFSVKLPLTLAITDGMLVRVGEQRYILPTVSIQMSLRPEPGAVSTVTGRGEMVLLRGRLIPIIRMHRLFRIPGALTDPGQALLVVVDDGARQSAVMVDELLGQQQVVAKSLGEGVGRVGGVSGGAILGDGRVGLILDPAGLAAMAREGRTFEGAAELMMQLAA